jgi:hypothetical protein
MPGNNAYPNPENYPSPSFQTPATAPDVDPDEGAVVVIGLNAEWIPVVEGALDQLLLPSTWTGDHDTVILALNRASNLKMLVGAADVGEVETPFWDDESDVDDDAPADDQPWYGEVTNPDAPAGELTFVENALLWAFTGLVAIATFEVAGVAPAIFFHTSVEKFIILQKRGDTAETIRFVVDGQDMKYVNTTPYAPGDIISTEIITPQTGGAHDLLIIGGSS